MVGGGGDSSDGEAGDDKAGAGDDLGGSAKGAGAKAPAKTGGGDGGGAGGKVPAKTRIAGDDGRRSPSPREKKSTWDPRFARFDDDGAPSETGLLNGGGAGSNSTAAPAAAGAGGGAGAPQNKLTSSGGSTSSHRVAAQKANQLRHGRAAADEAGASRKSKQSKTSSSSSSSSSSSKATGAGTGGTGGASGRAVQTGRAATKTSIYRGVTKTSGASWGAKFASKRICSTCATEEVAARLYDAHLKKVDPMKYKLYANFCPDCHLFRNTQRLVDVERYAPLYGQK
jgi:hypothetical protein